MGFILALASTTAMATDAPWRLQTALDLPDWFQVSGSTRVRYETLGGQFRSGYDGGDQQLAFRTLIEGRLQFENWGVVGELEDSRQQLADHGSPINTTMVNTTEMLQAYLQLKANDLIHAGSFAEVRLGRQTMDVGSRRLIARNRFRNTLNAFDGAALYWNDKASPDLQLFYFRPVVRRPSGADDLLDNEQEADRSYSEYQFWGIHSTWAMTEAPQSQFEAYFFGLNENDGGGRESKDRNLYTPGIRFYRKPAKNAFDYDFEMVVQFGTQRGSTASSDNKDLNHWAQFAHAEVGYTQDSTWSPRVAFLFDYASGDRDPDDNDSNRFDTLYGARRFEYGPTGIFGAFARSNILSPGVNLKVKPSPRIEVQLAYRAYWLAADKDAWTTSGLQDPSGKTDSFVGQEIDSRLKWDIIPGNLSADMGVSYLFAGPFIHDAPNSDGKGDSTYAYVSLAFKF
jgi:hypothetical protein